MAAVTSVGRATGFEPFEPVADSGAAAALYERHSSRIFGYCLSRLGRREDAEDAVQTTFLHAVRGLHRGVVPATEIAWLLGIARNVCLSRWETVSRRSKLESPCDPFELDMAGTEPEDSRDELIGLEHALLQLPDQQRRAVLLRDWRGLSYEEIAAQLGVSHAAVETLIFRGRRTLAELLREEPQATKSRLRSLGNLGSLFSAIKTAFTGGAVATKVAMAAITAVALSGAGAVAGTSLHGGGSAPTKAPAAKTSGPVASVAPGVQAGTPKSSASRTPAAQRESATPSAKRSAAPSATAPAVATAATAVPSAPAASTPGTAGPTEEAGSRTPSSSETHSPPHSSVLPATPAPPPPVTVVVPTDQLVPAVTGAVEKTVDKLLPTLPVELPPVELPAVELPPVEVQVPAVQVPAVPGVVPQLPAVLPPVTVTLPPTQIVPPKLLP